MSSVQVDVGKPAEGGRMKVRDAATIRRVRELRGLSQRELAFLCRPCSQTTIYLLETGRMRSLSPQLAVRIAKRLDADVLDLFAERH
jgi:transcriptional regulator with XRE-family HTH domain